MSVKRLVVGVTGATGAIYALRLLQAVKAIGGVETHLVMSASGILNVEHELRMSRQDLDAFADHSYGVRDVGATIASGSFATMGMIVTPCSMRTLAAVAHGLSDNLITRAADVTLKERRRLILMVRETPFNLAHLRNMTAVTEMGGIIFPPLPAFYHQPTSIDELVDHSVSRVLDLVGLDASVVQWAGLRQHQSSR